MKRSIIFLFLIGLLSTLYAQESRFSLGIVGTRFSNTDNSNKLTEIEDPVGYGLMFAYAVNEHFSVALTGEYFKDDMEDYAGEERDIRTHLSGYLIPADFSGIKPYISFGVVYTNRNYDYTNEESENDNLFNGRFGAGLDYHIISNLNFNVDFGFYNDGLNFVGWTSSAGLRYGLNF